MWKGRKVCGCGGIGGRKGVLEEGGGGGWEEGWVGGRHKGNKCPKKDGIIIHEVLAQCILSLCLLPN